MESKNLEYITKNIWMNFVSRLDVLHNAVLFPKIINMKLGCIQIILFKQELVHSLETRFQTSVFLR